ncbi:MAG: hypothetical protein ACRCVA_05910 [Phreatobacter sp.]
MAAADLLLVDPRIERRFWRDRTSADAAFLKIRYAGLSHQQAAGLIDELKRRSTPPQRIEELRLAHARPAERATLLGGPQETSVNPMLSPSAFRAAVLDDDGERFFAAVRRNAAPLQTLTLADATQVQLARSLADLDDGTKARFAGRAEAAGFWRFGLELLATGADPSGWLAALKRSPIAPANATKLAELFAPLWRGYATLNPRAYQLDTLPEALREAAAILDARRTPDTASIDSITTLVRLAPRAQFLMTLLNQTGVVRLGSEVAEPLVQDIRAGRIDPAKDDDALQILIFSGVDRVLGRTVAATQLVSFPSGIGSAPGETTLMRLERTVARQALRPYLVGDRPAAPERPLPLSAAFDWTAYIQTAGMIRASTAIPYVNRPIAAELLEAAGRYPEALQAWQGVADREASRAGLHALLLALDQRCERLMSPPMPLQEPVYRFEPR